MPREAVTIYTWAMPIDYDESRSPLVVITSRGSTTDPDFESYLAKMIATLSLKRRYGVLFDARDAERPTPAQRRRQAQWMKEHAPLLKQYSVGMAFVIDKAIIRGSLTAILWLQPMPMAHTVCATVDAAEAWLGERLKAVGLRPGGRHVG